MKEKALVSLVPKQIDSPSHHIYQVKCHADYNDYDDFDDCDDFDAHIDGSGGADVLQFERKALQQKLNLFILVMVIKNWFDDDGVVFL